MLPLENFETYFSQAILKRGRTYANNGSIVELEEIDDDEWVATVVGSYDYSVSIGMGFHDELEMYCDCPYDGGYCKHLAAVLYKIREQQQIVITIEKPTESAKPAKKKKANHKQQVREVLETLEKSTLINIILDQLKTDKTLGNQLILKYSTGEPDKDLYKKIIQDNIRKAQGRHGYIDYSNARQSMAEAWNIHSEAENLISGGNFSKAIPLLQAIYETVPDALYNSDDSSGYISGVIMGALNSMADLAEGLKDEQSKQDLLDYCLQEAQKDNDHLNYDISLWDVAAILVETADHRNNLFKVMDGAIAKVYDSWSKKHYEEHAVLIKQNIMQKLGDPEEKIEQFLHKNIHLDRIRKQLIQKNIEQDNLVKARELSLDGITQAQQNRLPGLVRGYEDFILQIVQKEGNPEALIELAQRMFLESYSFEYYDLLKKNTPSEQWQTTLENLLASLQKTTNQWGYRTNNDQIIAELYFREKMWDELMALASQNIWIMQSYEAKLAKQFPEGMCDIYESIVFRMLEQTSNREQYKAACGYLRKIKKAGQKERAEQIRDLLVETYANRSAMIQELRKL